MTEHQIIHYPYEVEGETVCWFDGPRPETDEELCIRLAYEELDRDCPYNTESS